MGRGRHEVLAVAVTPLLYTYEMDVGARGGNKMDGKWSKVIKVFIPGCYPRSNARSKPRELRGYPIDTGARTFLRVYLLWPSGTGDRPCITVTYTQLRRSSSRLFLAREIFLSSVRRRAIYFAVRAAESRGERTRDASKKGSCAGSYE